MYKWIDWVSKNMNEFHKIPSEGRYSLELKLSWSAKKIMVLVTTPVILSLVIGTWYMQSTGDTQTAWTIASYIVTAAGGKRGVQCPLKFCHFMLSRS